MRQRSRISEGQGREDAVAIAETGNNIRRYIESIVEDACNIGEGDGCVYSGLKSISRKHYGGVALDCGGFELLTIISV